MTNSESKPSSSTVRAKALMPRARSGPSPSQTYEGRKTPNRPTSLMCVHLVQGFSHRPRYSGSRFSKKDRAPSSMSSVSKIRSDASSSAARPVSMSVSVARSMQALRLADRERAARGDLLADRRRPRDGLAGRHDLVDEADPLGLGRRR